MLAGRPSNDKAAHWSVIRPFVKWHFWFWKIGGRQLSHCLWVSISGFIFHKDSRYVRCIFIFSYWSLGHLLPETRITLDIAACSVAIWFLRRSVAQIWVWPVLVRRAHQLHMNLQSFVPAWFPKRPCLNGCFNWMISNLYMGVSLNGGTPNLHPKKWSFF